MWIGQRLKALREQRRALDREEQTLLDELRVLAGPSPDELGAPVPEDEAEARADEEAIVAAVREIQRREEIRRQQRKLRRPVSMLEQIRSLLRSEPAKIFTIPEIRARLEIRQEEEPSFYSALSKLVKFKHIDRVEKGKYRSHLS